MCYILVIWDVSDKYADSYELCICRDCTDVSYINYVRKDE